MNNKDYIDGYKDGFADGYERARTEMKPYPHIEYDSKVFNDWELLPEIACSNPPQNIWKCKSCGARIYLSQGKYPDLCECHKKGGDSSE